MAQSARKKHPPALATRPVRFWQRMKEISLFFEGRSREHKTMRRVVEKLEKAGIPYAVLGGMAVNAHGYRRTTGDVDILLTSEGFAQFRKRFVPKAYDPVAGRPRRFFDRRHQCGIDILVTGLFPGSGRPGPVAFPDPAVIGETIDDIHVVNLPTLIQLKLAARRYSDFGDVVNLIRAHNLDESYLARIHPSLQRDFIECLEEKRREDEYEARQDQQMEEHLRENKYESEES
jgi:hypothetical protein